MSAPIYLVRHGETVWNREGRIQGRLDSPLTEQGLSQAARVAAPLVSELGRKPALRLMSSPLGRARDTAAIVAAALEVHVSIEPLLSELNLGSWNGLTRAEIEARWPEALRSTDEHNWFYCSPDGETIGDIRRRAIAWLEAQTEPVIAVSHGLFGRVLRGAYAGLLDEEAIRLSEPQDAVFVLHNGIVGRLGAAFQR